MAAAPLAAALALVQGSMPQARQVVPAIYSSRTDDPWNRIFALLYTRTVSTRMDDEFPEAAPFRTSPDVLPNPGPHRVSTRTFERVEEGDRAIDALYPSFITSRGITAVLGEPRKSQLIRALGDALAEQAPRPPLDRAFMQTDLWSTYDALSPAATGTLRDETLRTAAADVAPLLARLIQKLALTTGEIAGLPDNYAAARRSAPLPDLFTPGSPWIEIVWNPHRMHDEAANDRRAARVFVRPAAPPADADGFVRGLRSQTSTQGIAGLALVMQALVVDTRGRVVPTHLVSDVQIRTMSGDARGVEAPPALDEYELSRHALLTSQAPGGFVHLGNSAPAYLPLAGNDYGFATPARDARGETEPVLGTLRTRCVGCHGPNVAGIFTLSVQDPARLPPPTRLLQPNDTRAAYVAAEKEQRDDFRRLAAAFRGAR